MSENPPGFPTCIDASEAAGRTVKNIVVAYEDVLVQFEDGTFCHFYPQAEYDSGPEMFDGGRGTTLDDLDDVPDSKLIEAGYVTIEYLDERYRQRKAAIEAEQIAHDREHYERLRARFGPIEVPRS